MSHTRTLRNRRATPQHLNPTHIERKLRRRDSLPTDGKQNRGASVHNNQRKSDERRRDHWALSRKEALITYPRSYTPHPLGQ